MFARASKSLVGGVNSPVRAFAVGGSPLFIRQAAGAYIEDADGRRYVDYVMSWGPLIHGTLRAACGGRLRRCARDAERASRPRARD